MFNAYQEMCIGFSLTMNHCVKSNDVIDIGCLLTISQLSDPKNGKKNPPPPTANSEAEIIVFFIWRLNELSADTRTGHNRITKPGSVQVNLAKSSRVKFRF